MTDPTDTVATWLVSSRLKDGGRAASDTEMTLTESAVRALGRHLAELAVGLKVETYNRPAGLSLLTVTARNGRTLNLSREWDADELVRRQMRADLADALRPTGGPNLEVLSLLGDIAEADEERDQAKAEARELRAALAAANAREVLLNDTIAELRVAQSAPAGPVLPAPAPMLALVA